MNGVKGDWEFERVVQWYPGHMAAAMRRIGEYMTLIDIVVEVIDARVPASGANPMLDAVAARRARLRVFTRDDLADPIQTASWLRGMRSRGEDAEAIDAKHSSDMRRIARKLDELGGRARSMRRAMVVGVPNSGKSSVINGLLGRSAARAENRAGITRRLQWFRLGAGIELMDTPGILVPRIASRESQWKLALVGAVPRERYDPADIARRFHRWLLETRTAGTKMPDLDEFCRSRGFLRAGGETDYHNAAQAYIKDFNEGKFGRITLDRKPEDDAETA